MKTIILLLFPILSWANPCMDLPEDITIACPLDITVEAIETTLPKYTGTPMQPFGQLEKLRMTYVDSISFMYRDTAYEISRYWTIEHGKDVYECVQRIHISYFLSGQDFYIDCMDAFSEYLEEKVSMDELFERCREFNEFMDTNPKKRRPPKRE